jgi:hypothetical protein
MEFSLRAGELPLGNQRPVAADSEAARLAHDELLARRARFI